MRHRDSVFHTIARHIPWGKFDRLVDRHNAGHRVRRPNSKGHLLAPLFGQLSGADSLRAIAAALYRQRWQIELFFKWIKQNLEIERFPGTSQNAVAIQVFAAPISYPILRAAHQAHDAIPSSPTFTRLVRLNLMHKRSLNDPARPPTPPPQTAGSSLSASIAA